MCNDTVYIYNKEERRKKLALNIELDPLFMCKYLFCMYSEWKTVGVVNVCTLIDQTENKSNQSQSPPC